MSAISAELEIINELLRRPTAANLDRVASHLEAVARHLHAVIGERAQTEAITTAFGNWLKSQTAAVNRLLLSASKFYLGMEGEQAARFGAYGRDGATHRVATPTRPLANL
jgi:hypothetical protein